jgi:16S rRNA C1402 N4-methylase RsmH
MRLIEVAHRWLEDVIKQGDMVVDATLGNGFDALFLAQQVGKEGCLYAFDVQKQAVEASKARLENEHCEKHLLLQGHQYMLASIPPIHHGHIKAMMFNLGWLPNSDKSIVTHSDTTLTALEQSLKLLCHGGRLSVMVYPGHEGGDREAVAVIDWSSQLSESYLCNKIEATKRGNLKRPAPILLHIEKKRL